MELIPPVVAAVLLVGVIIKKGGEGLLPPLIVVLGAGVSNYVDLLRFGYVRDPLSIGTFVFNVADIFIFVGACWAIWVYTRR